MKILCIDGGGIRGVFAIEILRAIEEDHQQPISQIFDCIAGTSTGSIIAAAIVLEKEMSKILESYKKYGKKIFTRQAKVGLFKSVYSDKYLRRYFQQVFNNITLSDIQKPLLIPAVDITHGKPFVYRSNYGHNEDSDYSIKLWDAVLSSCSAPVYFPPNNIENRYLSIDGGLWANNPSLVCITEALQHQKRSLSEIQILSIGTGLQKIDFSIEKERDWGANHWLPFLFPSMKVTPKLLDLALHLSSESVSYHCQHLLGENYLRINEEMGEEVTFDDLTYIDHLIELASNTYKKKREAISAFLKT